MNSNDIVLKFIEIYERLSIPYMLVGSYSSNAYGRPRSTQDADFVVQISAEALTALRRELGPDFMLDPQMSFETVTATMRYIVQHTMTGFKVELFLLSDEPHDQARFSRRRVEDFQGHDVRMPTAEDVIVTKLRWSKQGKRQKDVEDVAGVIAVQGEKLDLPYIRGWCDRHGTREMFDRLLEIVPR